MLEDTDIQIFRTHTIESENSRLCLPENELDYSIENSLESLSYSKNHFSFFDLHFSDFEKNILRTIQIPSYKQLLLHSKSELTYTNLETFLESDNTPTQAENFSEYIAYSAKLILDRIDSVIRTSEFDDAKITLLSYKADIFYDPYWHVDKTIAEIVNICPVTYGSKPRHVFILPIVGEGTLFCTLNSTERELFNNYSSNSPVSFGYFFSSQKMPLHDRINLFNESKIVSTEPSFGSVHFAGTDYGTIHATPATKNGRILAIISPDETWALKAFEDAEKAGFI